MINYKECMDYVENYLISSGGDHGPRYPFRSRSSHTKRVVLWAKRLCEQRTAVNEEVLITAAIFHDVGYVFKHNKDNSLGNQTEHCDIHAARGADIFHKFAAEHNFDPEFTAQVAHCIKTHSDKFLLKESEKLKIEQILLMEADLLDEEGALAICWDNMAYELMEGQSYKEAYQRSKKTSDGKWNRNPMVTKKAREFWEQKQNFVKAYLEQMSVDVAEVDFSSPEHI